MARQFNHVFTLAFSVNSADKSGADVTPDMLLAALLKRVANVHETASWDEAVGCPDDSARVL